MQGQLLEALMLELDMEFLKKKQKINKIMEIIMVTMFQLHLLLIIHHQEEILVEEIHHKLEVQVIMEEAQEVLLTNKVQLQIALVMEEDHQEMDKHHLVIFKEQQVV